MNHISHGLWISDIDTVQNSETGQFDMVVSVCQDACRDNISDETPYEHYRLADDVVSEREWGGAYAYDLYASAADTLVNTLRDDRIENVLCHCHVGRNRSASICGTALAVYDGTTYLRGIERVRNVRPIANPTPAMNRFGRQFVDTHRVSLHR